MSRSTEILYRARRDLKKLTGIDYSDPEYFDSMQQGQIDILTQYQVKKDKFTLTTVADQESYSLLQTTREMVGKILAIQKPSLWYLNIEYLNPDRYAEEKEKTQIASQPVWCTVLNNNILFNPAPGTDGLELTVWALLFNSSEDITAAVDPEIRFTLDKALQYYVVWDLLPIDSPLKSFAYERYRDEAERKSHLDHDEFSHQDHIEGNW